MQCITNENNNKQSILTTNSLKQQGMPSLSNQLPVLVSSSCQVNFLSFRKKIIFKKFFKKKSITKVEF